MGKKREVKCVAANEARKENLGETKVRRRKEGSHEGHSITLQVSGVGKVLASVSRLLGKLVGRFAAGPGMITHQ